jgi:hypothetical protein
MWRYGLLRFARNDDWLFENRDWLGLIGRGVPRSLSSLRKQGPITTVVRY